MTRLASHGVSPHACCVLAGLVIACDQSPRPEELEAEAQAELFNHLDEQPDRTLELSHVESR